MVRPPADGAVEDVQLDALLEGRAQAELLAGWLGEMFGGWSGTRHLDNGWSALAHRNDGSVFEVGAFGYVLHESVQAFEEGGRVMHALRRSSDS